MKKDYETMRAELWCSVYVAYVGASNSTKSEGAKNWADTATNAFDERFKERLTKADGQEVKP